MADFHAADLWVAVVPETSQVGPAMEKAGKEAKDKFGTAVKDFGKSIHDDLGKIGEKAKDVFGKAGKTAGEIFSSEIGKELTNTAAQEIGKALGEAVRELPGVERGVELFKEWGDAAKIGAGAIQDMGGAMQAAKAGDFKTAIDGLDKTLRGLEPVADKFGVDLKGLGATDTTKSLGELNTIAGGLSTRLGEAKGAVDRLGTSGGGLNGLIGKMGELGLIASTVISSLDEIKSADDWLERKIPFYKDLDEAYKNGPLKAFKGLFNDDSKPTSPPLPIMPGSRTGQMLLGGQPGPTSSSPDTLAPWANNPWFTGSSRGSSGSSGGSSSAPSFAPPDMPEPSPSVGGSSYTKPSIGTPTDAAGLAAAGSRVANLYAFAKSLAGTPYSTPLRNDCSGMVAELAAVAVGLPPPAAGARFSTANEGEWLAAHGFQPGLGGPNDLNIGWHQGGPGGGHTAATLPGGIHAEQGGGTAGDQFTLGAGAAGAESSQFDQHAHLAMNGMGGGAQIPTGAEHDPIYTMQAAQGAGGGGGSPAEQQGQQLGQGLGKGFLQLLGLDGSVFGGKSPLDWGAVKLGMGALNWGLGQAKGMGGGGGPMGSPMGSPMGAMGGGGGGALGALTGLIPSPGPGISAAAVPGGSQSVARATGAGNTNYHVDNSVTVSGNTTSNVTGWMQAAQEAANKNVYPRVVGLSSGLPA